MRDHWPRLKRPTLACPSLFLRRPRIHPTPAQTLHSSLLPYKSKTLCFQNLVCLKIVLIQGVLYSTQTYQPTPPPLWSDTQVAPRKESPITFWTAMSAKQTTITFNVCLYVDVCHYKILFIKSRQESLLWYFKEQKLQYKNTVFTTVYMNYTRLDWTSKLWCI